MTANLAFVKLEQKDQGDAQKDQGWEQKRMSEQLVAVSQCVSGVGLDVRLVRRQVRFLAKQVRSWEKAWSWKNLSSNTISLLQIMSTALAIWAAWAAMHVHPK